MKNNRLVGYILPAIVIMAGGFVLFNFAFIVFALIVNLSISLLGVDPQSAPPILSRILGFFALIFITWLGFKINFKSESIKHTLRATLITMPLMAVLVAIGVMLYQQPQWMILLAGALVVAPALYYVWRLKLPWMYHFAILYVTILALYIMFSGLDI
jgi:hypothetical protein